MHLLRLSLDELRRQSVSNQFCRAIFAFFKRDEIAPRESLKHGGFSQRYRPIPLRMKESSLYLVTASDLY